MEWTESAGFHMACLAVRPSTATEMGAYQSSLFQALRNCSRRIERRFTSFFSCGCWAATVVKIRLPLIHRRATIAMGVRSFLMTVSFFSNIGILREGSPNPMQINTYLFVQKIAFFLYVNQF